MTMQWQKAYGHLSNESLYTTQTSLQNKKQESLYSSGSCGTITSDSTAPLTTCHRESSKSHFKPNKQHENVSGLWGEHHRCG